MGGAGGGRGACARGEGKCKHSSYSFQRKQRKSTPLQTENEPRSDLATASSCQAYGRLRPDEPLPLLLGLAPARPTSLRLCSAQPLLSLQNLQVLPAATEGSPSSHLLRHLAKLLFGACPWAGSRGTSWAKPWAGCGVCTRLPGPGTFRCQVLHSPPPASFPLHSSGLHPLCHSL